jgi:large subunit ribosomal protein L15
MKLNEIRNNPGAHRHKHKVGRGSSSGLGKTSGRGVKGAKARTGTKVYGFEGGQMPLHMRMPKRGFNNIFRKDFAEVNLWRLEQAIAAGKLDAKKAMDAEVLIAAGFVRRKKDGLRLLGKGEIKSKINITVYSASAAAVAAVEKAGGTVTTTKKEAPAAEA